MAFLPSNSLVVQYVSGELEELTLACRDDRTVSLENVSPVYQGVADFLVASDRQLVLLLRDHRLCRYSVRDREILGTVAEGVSRILGETGEGILVSMAGGNRLLGSPGAPPSWLDSFKNRKISAVYEGNEQITWIGTDGEGLFKVYPQNKVFGLCSALEVPALAGGIVRAFCETPDGSFWVGTKGNGLIRMNKDCYVKRSHTHRTYHAANSGMDNSVFSLFYGQDQILYIGTDDAPALFDLKRERLVRWDELKGRPATDAFKSTYAIFQDPDSVVWLGTNGYGLVRFRLRRQGYNLILSDYRRYLAEESRPGPINSNMIFAIVPENDSLLWLGTRLGGLHLFHKKSGRSVAFRADDADPRSLSNNDILCLHQDRENRLWVGTSLGLNRLVSYDLTGEAVFDHFTTHDGLPNNTIHGIVSDREGDLWISTNDGLSRLTPSDGQFRNYSAFDGLQNNEFADGASYFNPGNGMVFMGGINGFNYFDPSAITQYPYMPSLLISGIREQYRNKSVFNLHIIGQQTVHPPEIVLRHNQNFFNIKLAVLSYINTEKCRYAYRLENFDQDWNEIGTRREISFTNVPPGEYGLWLKWTNCDGVWSQEVRAVNFRIRPVFWQSAYAVAIYSLFGILLTLLVLNYLKKRSLLRQNQLLLRREDEIHQTRLTFFTNVAHELQTPLTLIAGPAQKLADSSGLSGEDQKFVTMIQRNTSRLLFLIHQLLEFRKAENLHLEIKRERFNLIDLVEQISELFDEMALRKKIEYRLELPHSVVGWFDQDKIEKILFNLLSNAFKYTPEGGKVTLQISTPGKDKVEMSVANTGEGIPGEKLNRLFERFFIPGDREHTEPDKFRTGIGLAFTKSLVNALRGSLDVKSIENEWTTFRVALPCGAQETTGAEGKMTEVTLSGRWQHILPDAGAPEEMVPGKIRKIEAFGNGQKKILIVEDEPEIHTLLDELLQEKYGLITAHNGLEALQILEKEMPDLIISDVMMPVMDGIEFCRTLKSNLDFCHIPVILLTARSSVIHRIEGLESGANSYIPKPFHPKHLEVRIAKLLEERERIAMHFAKDAEMNDISGLPLEDEARSFIDKVIQTITRHLDDPDLQAGLLEKELGMSSTNFYRKLKQISGLAPGDMIRTVRLKHAAGLLRQTSMNVTEVFYRSGFNNRSYFYREFHKMYQLPPKQYQKKYNKRFV